MNDRIGKLKEVGLYGDYTEEELPNNIIDLIYNKETVYNESSSFNESPSFSESSGELVNDLDEDDDYVYDIIAIAFTVAKYWYIFGN